MTDDRVIANENGECRECEEREAGPDGLCSPCRKAHNDRLITDGGTNNTPPAANGGLDAQEGVVKQCTNCETSIEFAFDELEHLEWLRTRFGFSHLDTALNRLTGCCHDPNYRTVDASFTAASAIARDQEGSR